MSNPRSRWSPMRLIEDWEALYWDRNLHHYEEKDFYVFRRTQVAWWCQRRIETATAVWQVLALPKDQINSDVNSMPLAERAFYKTKAVLCLLAGRDGGDLDDDAGYARMLEAIRVVYYNLEEHQTLDGSGGSCDEVHVGHGLLKHWYAYVERESWP